MGNLYLYDKVRAVPTNALKKITGGRLNGMSDINPMWRIKMLTEQFGVCGFGWHYEVIEKDIMLGANDEMKCFVTIHLSVKIGEEWSRPIVGMGGSSFVSAESKGLYTNDECYKMALTDALGNACKSLGIGADVYFEKDVTKYQQAVASPDPPAAPPVDMAAVRTNVEKYLYEHDEYREQIFKYYNYGVFEDFTDKDILSIEKNLKKNNKL